MRKPLVLMMLLSLMTVLSVSCASSKKKDAALDATYLTPKIIFSSKWKQFSVKHPAGFWQVITREKWTILYNNQDAPVQMVIDANRHYLLTPGNEKILQRFLRSMKAKDISITGTEKTMVEGVEALKTTLTATILFDFWDDFLITRKMTILSFSHNHRSYLIAYVANEESFEKYSSSYDTLISNFSFEAKTTTKDEKPSELNPHGPAVGDASRPF